MKKIRIGIVAMVFALSAGGALIVNIAKADPPDSCANFPVCSKTTQPFCCNVYNNQGMIIDSRNLPLH
jgi:hypothetical protein